MKAAGEPATLTLKNVPPGLHRKLKAQAKRHKRSLNQEAILCLERSVADNDARRRPRSLASPPPPVSAGSLLRPFSTRAEMLEDFLDRDATDEIHPPGSAGTSNP
jgi:plasmid stability protein